MLDQMRSSIRQDCLHAVANQGDIVSRLSNSRIAITGGTGFLGSWLAEMVIVLNEEFSTNIKLDLFARNIDMWQKLHPHFASHDFISCFSRDIRSPFVFSPDTAFVIHAAGSPSSRIHVSDPLGTVKTIILGAENSLHAASKLSGLERFVNVSSCFVVGKTTNDESGLKETDCFPIQSGSLDSAYCDAKRTAETLCSIYRSSFRLPISTLRPFTFTGPYQSLHNPWAINNFINDVISGNDIRIHGDGSAKRSYLYGSDAAFWVLTTLIKGSDGGVYNLGGCTSITHNDLAEKLRALATKPINIRQNTLLAEGKQNDYLFPDMRHAIASLKINETCSIEQALARTVQWFQYR